MVPPSGLIAAEATMVSSSNMATLRDGHGITANRLDNCGASDVMVAGDGVPGKTDSKPVLFDGEELFPKLSPSFCEV